MKQDNFEAELLPLVPMAARIGVRPCELRVEANAGTMPHVRVGKSGLLFDPERVFAVLAERARVPQSDSEEERGGR